MKTLNYMALIGLGFTLAACGSSGSSDSTITPTTPAPTTPDVYKDIVGYIDSVDSSSNKITVNGATYDANAATLEYKDRNISFDSLEQGMKVEIDTKNNTIVELELEPSVVGKVNSISDNNINVGGVALTFDNINQDIMVNDQVVVSTLTQANNTIVTSIAKTTVTSPTEIEGTVSQHDTTAQTFVVLGMTVDYANARIDADEVIANSVWVEVVGTQDGTILRASEVDVEDDTDYQDREIEGVVSWVANDKSAFEVDSHIRVSIDQNTRYEDGTVNNLVINTLVSVDMVSVNNKLVATEIDFETNGSTGTGGTGAAAKEFTLSGIASVSGSTIIINNFEFAINASTEFDDGLTLGNVSGRYIEIEGILVNGVNTAKEVEANTDTVTIDLEGQVENNTLWGYSTSDNSLDAHNNQWVEVECQRNGDDLLNCRLDN